MKDIIQNNWHILKHIKVDQVKEELWVFSRLKNTKEIQQPSATHHSGLDSFAIKDILGTVIKPWMESLDKGYMEFFCIPFFLVNLELFKNKQYTV